MDRRRKFRDTEHPGQSAEGDDKFAQPDQMLAAFREPLKLMVPIPPISQTILGLFTVGIRPLGNTTRSTTTVLVQNAWILPAIQDELTDHVENLDGKTTEKACRGRGAAEGLDVLSRTRVDIIEPSVLLGQLGIHLTAQRADGRNGGGSRKCRRGRWSEEVALTVSGIGRRKCWKDDNTVGKKETEK